MITKKKEALGNQNFNTTVFLNDCVIAPRKMRMVADLLRGKDLEEALKILSCVERKCVVFFEKLLRSAFSSLERKCVDPKTGENVFISPKQTVIEYISVDSAGMLKRLLPAPQGRAYQIIKRLSSVKVKVGCFVGVQDNIIEEKGFLKKEKENGEEK